MTASRKRMRSGTDDCEDCIPISKRINRLHIRPSNGSDEDGQEIDRYVNNNNLKSDHPVCSATWNSASGQNSNNECSSSSWQEQNVMSNQHSGQFGQSCNSQSAVMTGMQMHSGYDSNMSGLDCGIQNQNMNQYEPDMSPQENPHYYHVNQLLFSIHMERLQRHPVHLQQPHS